MDINAHDRTMVKALHGLVEDSVTRLHTAETAAPNIATAWEQIEKVYTGQARSYDDLMGIALQVLRDAGWGE